MSGRDLIQIGTIMIAVGSVMLAVIPLTIYLIVKKNKEQ